MNTRLVVYFLGTKDTKVSLPLQLACAAVLLCLSVRCGCGQILHNWPYAARKRTGDAESSWRPPPDKNIEPVPY
jgi:hypothetical protein